jgi:hypothetical protein
MPPDPNDYSAVLVMRGYAGLKADVLRVTAKLEADGQLLAAREISAAFVELTEELHVISADVAKRAHQAILDHEQQSRVRPDTQGGGPGGRLEDFIGESSAFPEVPGTVLINDESVLRDNVPWWWTNEEGYSGFIGRKISGRFFDAGWTGASRPSQDQIREHPLFRGAMRPPGSNLKGAVIKNPIPAREFVLEGYKEAEVEWHAAVRAARSRFDQRVRKASVLARQPRVP